MCIIVSTCIVSTFPNWWSKNSFPAIIRRRGGSFTSTISLKKEIKKYLRILYYTEEGRMKMIIFGFGGILSLVYSVYFIKFISFVYVLLTRAIILTKFNLTRLAILMLMDIFSSYHQIFDHRRIITRTSWTNNSY